MAKKNADEILYYYSLLYIPEIFKIKLISRYHDDLLAGNIEIDKI